MKNRIGMAEIVILRQLEEVCYKDLLLGERTFS